jgi:hypothetical protein
MFQTDKAQRALGWIADISLMLCMFIEIVIPHSTISQASMLLFFLCTGLWMLVNRKLKFSFWMLASGLVVAWSTVVSLG